MDNLIDFLSKCYQQITIKDNFLFIAVTCVALLIVLRLLFVCTIRIFVAVKMVLEFIFLSLKRTFYNKFDYSDYSPVNLKNEKHFLSFKSQLDSYLSNENVKILQFSETMEQEKVVFLKHTLVPKTNTLIP